MGKSASSTPTVTGTFDQTPTPVLSLTLAPILTPTLTPALNPTHTPVPIPTETASVPMAEPIRVGIDTAFSANYAAS